MKLISLYFSHTTASLFCLFSWVVYSSPWLKFFLSSSFILEDRVRPVDFRKQEWLFPETTANFDKLLIQYRGFCAYTFATTDGLLLPGILWEMILLWLPIFSLNKAVLVTYLLIFFFTYHFLKLYGIWRWTRKGATKMIQTKIFIFEVLTE